MTIAKKKKKICNIIIIIIIAAAIKKRKLINREDLKMPGMYYDAERSSLTIHEHAGETLSVYRPRVLRVEKQCRGVARYCPNVTYGGRLRG